VRFSWLLTFGLIKRCAAILASLFIQFQIKHCTMLCWFADDRNLQLEWIVRKFEIEITKKRIFSVAGQMFILDRCCLTEKIWSIDIYQLWQRFHTFFILVQSIFKWFVTVEHLAVEGWFDPPDQLNVKLGPHLTCIWVLVFHSWILVGCHLLTFSGIFQLGWCEVLV